MKKLIVIVLVIISFISLGQDVLKTCQVKMKCTLEEKPIPGTGSIIIKKGESVDVLDIDGGYYKVKFKGNLGYISDLFIYDADLINIVKQRKADAIVNQEKVMKERKENNKKYLIEQYGESRAALILKKLVCIGMTKGEVYESWGDPTSVNKTTSSYGVHEQWVYEGKNYKNRYLYFEDGIVTTIQE